MEPEQSLKDEVTELLGHDVETREEVALDVPWDPAEVLHLIHEMAYSLRELYSTNKELMKVVPSVFGANKLRQFNEAHDLLERYKDEYLGGSWEDHDKQDQLYR